MPIHSFDTHKQTHLHPTSYTNETSKKQIANNFYTMTLHKRKLEEHFLQKKTTNKNEENDEEKLRKTNWEQKTDQTQFLFL